MVTFVGCTVGFSFNIGNRYEAKNTLQKEKNFLFEVFLKMALSLVSHEAELGCISQWFNCISDIDFDEMKQEM